MKTGLKFFSRTTFCFNYVSIKPREFRANYQETNFLLQKRQNILMTSGCKQLITRVIYVSTFEFNQNGR